MRELNVVGYMRTLNVAGYVRTLNVMGYVRTLNVMGYTRELNIVGYMTTLNVMGYMRTVIDNNNGRNYTSETFVIEGAVFLAYIMGKLSYQNTCQEKILQKLPNSSLAQSVRKSRGMATVSDRSVLWRLLSPHLLPTLKTGFLWSLKIWGN